MPHASEALSDDVWARPFEPPDEQQAATAGLCAQMDQAQLTVDGPDTVTICELFETAGTSIGRFFDPIASDAGAHEDAARHLAPRSRNPAGIHADKADAGGRTETVAAMRVLVVEDDAIIGTLLAEMLAGMGHEVCAIEATEADAVSAAARCKPDLMIVDVSLGEGSGISAIETIHCTRPVPHVFASGDVSRVRALRPGSIFIQKPFRESDLARVIQQALDAAPLH